MNKTQPSCTTDSVVSVVLLRDDGAALMQLRDQKPGLRHAGRWVMPGGHADPGETVEACARRELSEETDYTCNELHWLTSFEDYDEQGRPLHRVTVFWASYDGAQTVQCLEGQALQFVERRLACSYAVPDYLVGIWDLALAAQRAARVAGTRSLDSHPRTFGFAKRSRGGHRSGFRPTGGQEGTTGSARGAP